MIVGYKRPDSVDEALELLAEPDAVIMAGGTVVTAATHRSPIVVIDLQAVGLKSIEAEDGAIRVGAMTNLQDIADSESVPAVLRDLAHRNAPNTIRNVATIGGTIAAAHPLNEFLAGLLAFGSSVSIANTASTATHPVDEVLANPGLVAGGIITHITIPTEGIAASARTARTPMDKPIVAAVAHSDATGSLQLALTGVGSTPLLVDPDSIGRLDPPSDFRGSTEYRIELAEVLARRVIGMVAGGVTP